MYERVVEKIVSIISLSLCAYIFYATIWGPYKTTMVHYAIFLAIMMIIYFLNTKPIKLRTFGTFYDLLMVFTIIFSLGYVIIYWEAILQAIGGTYLSGLQLTVGFAIIIVMLEGVRRLSFPLFLFAILAIAYILFGNYLPGVFSHAGLSVKRFIYLTAFSHEGIFGLAMSVATTYLFMFILFGTALQETGTADFMLRLTNAMVGRTRGGPAKSSVIGSGLTGTMIGSSIGNVVTTGSITIPMMKKSGFRPEVAGAIEVVASEGAQLVPPIMGAGAFLMAELTGIPYWSIAWAAIIPAFLYYVSVFVVVDMEAFKLGMVGIKSIENIWKIIFEGFHNLLPIIVLFYLLLVTQISVTYAGLITVILTIAVNQIRKNTRLSIKQVIDIFDKGTRGSAELTVLIGVVGIVQSAFTITGLGPRLSELLVLAAGGKPIAVLFISMTVSILLGMGMPTPIAYLLSALFVAPAMIEIGFSEMASHLFCFFFAIKSGSTPPIAVVAVVAAGIAKANWWKTAWISFVYSLPGFIIAYAFMYHPPYLMNGSWYIILISVVSGFLGTAGVAYAMQKHFLVKLKLWESLFLGIGSIILILYQVFNPIYGLIIAVIPCFTQWMKWRSKKLSIPIAT